MNGFSKALTDCRFGKPVRRTVWDQDQYVVRQLVDPDQTPWIMWHTAADGFVPWQPTVPDLLATDWLTVE